MLYSFRGNKTNFNAVLFMNLRGAIPLEELHPKQSWDLGLDEVKHIVFPIKSVSVMSCFNICSLLDLRVAL
jgi:hypothetical protein